MVICLERSADLHMAQLMPLPLAVSCFSKIQIGFTFLVPAHPGSPGQRAVKRVCVRLHRMRSPQKIFGKVPRQSCWRWPEKLLDPSSCRRKKKWISDKTYASIRKKREAKGKDKKQYQELKAEVQR